MSSVSEQTRRIFMILHGGIYAIAMLGVPALAAAQFPAAGILELLLSAVYLLWQYVMAVLVPEKRGFVVALGVMSLCAFVIRLLGLEGFPLILSQLFTLPVAGVTVVLPNEIAGVLLTAVLLAGAVVCAWRLDHQPIESTEKRQSHWKQ